MRKQKLNTAKKQAKLYAKTISFIAKTKEDIQIIKIDYIDNRPVGLNLIRKKHRRSFCAIAKNYRCVKYNTTKDLAEYAQFLKTSLPAAGKL